MYCFQKYNRLIYTFYIFITNCKLFVTYYLTYILIINNLEAK